MHYPGMIVKGLSTTMNIDRTANKRVEISNTYLQNDATSRDITWRDRVKPPEVPASTADRQVEMRTRTSRIPLRNTN